MKKKILIISSKQFGYLTDTLKYCEYGSNEFDITYVGWDYGLPKIKIKGITAKYISRKASLIMRNLRLLYAFHTEISNGYDIVFANYTRGISLLKLINPKTNFIVDVRTLCVEEGSVKRLMNNLLLKFELCFFKNITVISTGVAKKLKLRNYFLLPLGGECFTSKPKTFDKLSFLYVGTLQNRKILDCVRGFHLYLENNKDKKGDSVFTIVGSSPGNELAEIKQYVLVHKLENNIKLPGLVHQSNLQPFFENANVGVSYIPKRSYFKYQPPTKTFEYLISGLVVIATSTNENIKIVNENAGILIEDNSRSFCEGLAHIHAHKDDYNSAKIKEDYSEFTWHNLVIHKFSSLIRNLSN